MVFVDDAEIKAKGGGVAHIDRSLNQKIGAAEMSAPNNQSNMCEELSRHLLLRAEINS